MMGEFKERKFKMIDVAFPSSFDEDTNLTHVDTSKGEFLIIPPHLTEGMLAIIPPEGTPTVLEDESLRVYRLCDGDNSVGDIIGILKEEYPDESDKDIEMKVRFFMKSLVDEDILSE
ncbi:MAG: PqqD family peptide modification chaperone [Halobacteriota archaeon]|nr:PqqD family peptide modification chaperone [Halobacteriota archaeon]